MIHLYVGPMWAGKTSALIRAAKVYRKSGPVWVLKPSVDNRYEQRKIVSHNGVEIPATVIRDTEHLIEVVNLAAGVATGVFIDEIQFFAPEVVDVISGVAGDHISVHCAGLNLDCFGEEFETTAKIMEIATTTTMFVATCSCGGAAPYTQRFDENGVPVTSGDVVQVGGGELYRPVCADCREL